MILVVHILPERTSSRYDAHDRNRCPQTVQMSVFNLAAFFVLEEEGASGLTDIPMTHQYEVWDVLLAS